jgi:hypothetical protein
MEIPGQISAEIDKHKRPARARTLLMVAQGKVNSVPDSHPQRPAMERKLRVVKDKLRTQERDHEATR